MGLTKREVEYLLAVVEEEEEYGSARLSSIAQRLGVSPPAAADMLDRLRTKGYLMSARRGEYRLTDKGRKAAEDAIRKHRIIETWLTRVLGYTVEEGCRCASMFDYYVPMTVIDRLCSLLGHPDTCPHGKPIPPGTCHRGGGGEG